MSRSPLKQLAGETAIYGLSTILARIINFLFVPFYTRLLSPESYGVVTEFMAYIAVLQVVLVMGLETGCFRFANREGADPDKVYSNALLSVLAVSAACLAVLVVFRDAIAQVLGYAGSGACIAYMGGILLSDSVTAILFARLRQEHKALRFAVFKTVKILTETGMNILLFFPFSAALVRIASARGIALADLGPSDHFLLHFVSPTPDFSYVLFAILVSCLLCLLLFIPSLLHLRIKTDRHLLKEMLLYSLPLMVAALPGILNDFMDRILFRFFDSSSESWRASLGIFQAGVKLAVIMNLFIQMFRFAAEPFFFQRAKDRNSKTLYAQVMDWFTAFCGLIFLGVMLYMDAIGLILGKDFRSGVDIVPIMLLSYMLLGMNFNVSMWYKLSGKTSAALWITLTGLLVTTMVNVTLMPALSYHAAAWAHLGSYLVMFLLSAFLGQKYYPIPYHWSRITVFFLLMGLCWGAGTLADGQFFAGCGMEGSYGGLWWGKMALHTLLMALYAGGALWLLKRRHNPAA